MRESRRRLGYHGGPERSIKSEVYASATRYYGSNSSAYVTFQQTHMGSTILVRTTIHTRAVLRSIDQYMGMHQHFRNTPPLWELQWIVNQKKQRDDYVNKKHLPRFKQILRFTHTYINVLNISLMTLSISDDAKLNLQRRWLGYHGGPERSIMSEVEAPATR